MNTQITTIRVEEDILESAKKIAKKEQRSMAQILNRWLRFGFENIGMEGYIPDIKNEGVDEKMRREKKSRVAAPPSPVMFSAPDLDFKKEEPPRQVIEVFGFPGSTTDPNLKSKEQVKAALDKQGIKVTTAAELSIKGCSECGAMGGVHMRGCKKG